MKKIVDELLPLALQCGISIFDFYDMTFAEVQAVINAYFTKQKRELQQTASMVYAEASLTAMFVSRLISNKAKILTLYEAFPDLFKEEIKAEEKARQNEEKMAFLKFVERHNKEFENALQYRCNNNGENEERRQDD